MNKKKAVVAVVLLLAVAVLATYLRKGDFLYSGTIEATEVDISARLSSVIAARPVMEGDDVAKEQLLFALDCDDIKLSAEIAKKDFSRAEQMYKSGAVSQENYDRLKYKRDDAVLRTQWCSVKSPIGGRLLYTYHEPGELAAPGMKLATVADLGDVWAYIYVPQPAIAKLSLGMAVKGYLPELGMREFEGKIVKINDEAEFTPKNVQTRDERTRLVFGVKIAFPNSGGTLKPGGVIEIKLPAE